MLGRKQDDVLEGEAALEVVGKGTSGSLSQDPKGAKEAAKQSLSRSSEVAEAFAGSGNRKCRAGWGQERSR